MSGEPSAQSPRARWRALTTRIADAQEAVLDHARRNRRHYLAQGRLWVARGTFWLGAIAVGLAAVAFAVLTEEFSGFFRAAEGERSWLPFLVTPVAGIALVWVTRRWFTGAEGSGIPQVLAELEHSHHQGWSPLLTLRIAFAKVLIGASAVGAGFSLGREGPTVQVGAALMSAVHRYLPAALQIQRRHLIVAGGAAGIAAAFNTPLAGIVFAIEELSRGVETRLSGLIITAIVLAGVVSRAFLGTGSYFGQILLTGTQKEVFYAVALSALVCGLAGGLFARMLITAARGWTGRVADLRARRPYVFAGACGLLIAGLGWSTGGQIFGSGYEETRSVLEDWSELPLGYAPAKFAATVLSYLTGLPGGIFAPSLAIGAGIGNDLAPLLGQSDYPGMVLALCMTGFLAAATQAPITSFIIVMEMVDGYALVIAMMATALLSSVIARAISRPIYATLAEVITHKQFAALPPADVPPREGPGTAR